MRLLAFLREYWFPLGLVAAFLLTLPGLVVLILALAGADAEVNEWLREHWRISYQLAAPAPFVLGVLLLPLVLILLYFLKLKRQPIQVPSTFLWKKSIEDLHVNALFQWLRNNLLLLLQILLLLFLAYSLLGLRIHGNLGTTRHYILMIDNSASMSAQDVTPSRLEQAKLEALKEIDAANDGDVGMVLVFNSKASTLQTYTSNRGKLREAVQSIQPTQRPTRVDEALALAESLANPLRSTEDVASQPEDVRDEQKRTMVSEQGIKAVVHFYSDGRFQKLSESALANLSSRLAGNVSALGNLDVRYHAIGKLGRSNNVGIVSMNAVRHTPNAKAASDLQRLLVLVRPLNFRLEPTGVKLKLDVFVDGQLVHVDQKAVSLQARKVEKGEDGELRDEPGQLVPEGPKDARAAGSPAVTFLVPPLDLRKNVVLRAELDPGNDDFALDDQAWVAMSAARRAKVLRVGPPNPVLDAFFEQEATRRLADTEKLPLAELSTEDFRQRARSGHYDLFVFDRCAPESEADLPAANTFFIDAVPPPWQRGAKALKNPLMMPNKHGQQLLRFLTTLWDVHVSEAFAFDLEANLEPAAREKLKKADGSLDRRGLPALTRILETSNGLPLGFTLTRGSSTDLVLAFSLLSRDGDLTTDWPLQPSFPLFLRNVLYTLGGVDDSVRAVGTTPGEALVLRPEAGVTDVEVAPPQGAAFRLARQAGSTFVCASTEQLGVYRYRYLTGQAAAPQVERSFTVNLLDANESNVEPAEEIRIGGEKMAAGESRAQPREIWKWVLCAALILLIGEWMLYNRRIGV